ncbi:glycosyltransferase family 4 protein [Cupriavidus lacunae]|uniref:Glycosyltransferase family 1 protein n=1 Tax=Cupriavidus lacunae TaxID=2666307 RepID=A0A370P2N6_9BURK|nr:glycosyltransferase family 4 protein [Cupriavidus lacunae]RDK12122.1 glycosyltransferase family 1 protein [Cupriavidus lacunae]
MIQPLPTPPTSPRIAYLITNSEIGGAQAHVADLLRAMHGRAEVVVLAGGDGPLFDAARQAGVRTIRLPLLDNALSPMRAIATLRQLMQALRDIAPDLIHAHSAKAGALGRLAGWQLGIPVVYTVHGFGFKAAAPVRQRLASRIAEWLLAPLTSRLICVAEAERAMSESLPIPSTRVTVVRNGIPDTSALATPACDMRRIVMVARFAIPKRHDLLVRAFAQANLPDCELALAGEGPRLAATQQLAEALAPGRISFPGNVQDIPALLASAQAFALISDHEGFPLSVLEAMRAGLPVIASDLPGIREQLDDGRCGLLIAGNNIDALTQALIQLADDPARRTTLGQTARDRWEQYFGLERMAQATWSVYQHALSSGNRDSRLLAR